MNKRIFCILLTFFMSVCGPGYSADSFWGDMWGGGKIDADKVDADTTNFDTNLSSADSDVQSALETLDDLVALGGSTAWDDIGDPDNDGLTTIDFDHASENTTLTNIYDAAGSFFKIDNTDANLANETSLLGLEYTADADDQATFILASDNNGDTMWKLGVNGRMTIGPSATDYILPTARGAANTYLVDNGAGAVTF